MTYLLVYIIVAVFLSGMADGYQHACEQNTKHSLIYYFFIGLFSTLLFPFVIARLALALSRELTAREEARAKEAKR